MNRNIPTVLVVEDEAMLAMTMEIALQDAGYEVVIASTGDAALHELDAGADRFSAVVTDIRMPGKADGWEVGRRARELSRELPIVYVTGESEANWRLRGVAGSRLLTKPFPLKAIVSLLARLLGDPKPA